MEGYVTVTIGGERFTTHPDTLRKIPYFAAMLDRFGTTGEMTADRDPRGFRHILNHARDPSYGIPAKWAPEIAFYGITAGAVDATALMPAWFGDIPPMDLDSVGDRTYTADFSCRLSVISQKEIESMKFVFYRADDSVSVQYVEMWNDRESVQLSAAELCLLRAFMPQSLRNALDAYAATTGIHTIVLPADINVVYVVHFSGNIKGATTLSMIVPGCPPIHRLTKLEYPRLNYYYAFYDTDKREFVWSRRSSQVAPMVDIIESHHGWAKWGLPVWHSHRHPGHSVDGYAVYYFMCERSLSCGY